MSKIGFIDEFGDKSIEYTKGGVSTFFIVTAIIIETNKHSEFSNTIHKIRKSITQAPEIKSKNFKNKDFQKRLEILRRLSELDFYVYSIVVDKRKIWEESGLRFRNSFFKYFNKLLDLELYRYYPDIELVADEHGSEKFMDGFIDYVKANHQQKDLFINPKFRFAKSEDEPLIQVADLISGSLSKIYDPKKHLLGSEEIKRILEPKILHIREWPETPIILSKQVEGPDQKYDSNIAKFALQLVSDYIVQNENSTDEIVNHQLITLTYLQYRFKENPFDYIYTDEILKRIEQRSNSAPSIQVFRNKIIASLRDNNILIVSSSSGYKIPCSKSDLILFFNKYSQIITPMLSRLEKANTMIKIATNKEFDLLSIEEFSKMSELIRIINRQ